MKKDTSGFTIVELLIVIVVIAILATISIVAYNGIQDRANNAAVQSDGSTIAKKMEMAKIDLGHYPTSLAEMPQLKLAREAYDTTYYNVYYCHNTTTDEYAVGLRSKSSKAYIVTSSGIEALSGDVRGNETCAAVGETWGSTNVNIWVGYSVANGWLQSWSWTSD